MNTYKSLLADAVVTLNAIRGSDAGLWVPENNAAYTRLVEALGQDCHGEIYGPDIQLKAEPEPTEVQWLTQLAMEKFPDLVAGTKDLADLIQAAYEDRRRLKKRIKTLRASMKVLVENLAGEWSAADGRDQYSEKIDAVSPLKTGQHRRYLRALQMVNPRKSKYAIIDLVNWLLTRAEEKEKQG